nr:EthD domain-containing protein [Granulicella sp. dw_53]
MNIFMRRKEGMKFEEFSKHWRTVHAAVLTSQPASKRYIRRYIQCHRLAATLNDRIPSTVDGIAEVWFDDQASAEAFFATHDYQENIVADERKFMDRENCQLLFTDEVVVMQ